MMALDVCVRLAAASASATACAALVAGGHARWNFGLVALCATATGGYAYSAFGPWSMVEATMHEAALAWLVVVSAVEIGRRAFRPLDWPDRRAWSGVFHAAVLALLAVGALGAVVALAVPEQRLSGYRGLLVVEGMALAFVAMVRAGIAAHRRTLDRLGLSALLWLAAYCAVQGVYLASWELGAGAASALRVPVASAQLWCFLSLASAAWSPPLARVPA